MTTREQIIRQCNEILTDVIGIVEIKTDSDRGALALKTLVDYAMEGEDKTVKPIAIKDPETWEWLCVCGEPIGESQKYCDQCGNKLDWRKG